MNNGKINQTFLAATDVTTRNEILGAIAAHYGVTQNEAFDEVVGEEADHLLEYLVGSTRATVRLLMQRHEISACVNTFVFDGNQKQDQ